MDGIRQNLTQRARQLLHHWNVPDQVPDLLKYRENAVFRVMLAEGGNAALRLHRPGYHSPAALSSELGWMADLRQRGVPVPAPVPAADGAYLVALDSGGGVPQYAYLIGWVDGEPLGETGRPLGRPRGEIEAVFITLGAQMAHMHIAADAFNLPAGFERPSWDEAGLLGEHPFWGRFWDCDGMALDERQLFLSLRLALRQRLHAVSALLDQGLIHADLVRENVMVKNDAVAFIDFDDCGFGFRLFDIATALLRNRAEPDYPLIRDALLDGYLAIRPQMAAELPHLPLFLLLRSLTYIGWAGARPELPAARERLKRYIAEARELARLLEAA